MAVSDLPTLDHMSVRDVRGVQADAAQELRDLEGQRVRLDERRRHAEALLASAEHELSRRRGTRPNREAKP
jgi:hypothetical protein